MSMSAKESLKRIRSDRRRIQTLQEERKTIEIGIRGVSGIDQSGDRVSSSPRNAMESAAWRMLQRSERIDLEIIRLSDEVSRILEAVGKIKRAEYQEILKRRYVDGESLETIAEKMGYSYYHTCHLHGEALREYGSIINGKR